MPFSIQRFFRRALPFLFILFFLLFGLRASAHENALPTPPSLNNLTSLDQSVYLPLVRQADPQPITLIPAGAEWKYLDNGSDQGTAWREPSFDDSVWNQGGAQLGYGDGDETTVVSYGPSSSSKYITTYFRHTFNVEDLTDLVKLDFHILRDDGAVVYLNGQQVILSNVPAVFDYKTLAPLTMGLAGEKLWNVYPVDVTWLVPGTNVVAVEVHQNAGNSSDVSFDLSLTGLYDFSSEGTVRFAAIGDYGKNTLAEGAVASLVKSWDPEFIITLGDNNYPAGEETTITQNIDTYYGEFIEDTFETTRFFPSLGNHDWGDEAILSITCVGSICTGPYLDHFVLPGNERYYDFVKGPVHFFVLDSDPHEPDGNTEDSIQATWLKTQLALADEPWKLVYFHHAPYSSGVHGNYLPIQWPFKEWGASLVMTGHDHNYEHLIVNGFNYFVNGSGGANPRDCGTPVPGSQLCYDFDNGAMLIAADVCHITLTFTATLNGDIDAVLLENNQCH